MSDAGVWVKLEDAGSSALGAAVINDAASNYDSKDEGVEIDGKTYDIYTFTTATTTFSIRLTDEAMTRITDEDVLMAVATAEIPNDFDGDPVELFDSRYRDVLRNAFDVTPYADPGLSLTVDSAGMADVLLVGGGGAGGSMYYAGGGGGGGVIERSVFLSNDIHKVSVGSGAPATTKEHSASNGEDSYVGAYLAAGGGGGAGGRGFENQPNTHPPRIGGCGGGAAAATAITGAVPSGNQGFAGGNGTGNASNGAAAGGGGAGAKGGDGVSKTGGDGGAGVTTWITGSEQHFAGGGGGSSYSGTPGSGKDGGGNGGLGDTSNPTAGAVNTGGGGGGASHHGKPNGAAGGSGIVIVRVEI